MVTIRFAVQIMYSHCHVRNDTTLVANHLISNNDIFYLNKEVGN